MPKTLDEPFEEQKEKDRKEFLFKMYEQTWGNINRHLTIIWQSIAALIASVAVLGLVEKNIVPIDIAVGAIVLVSIWLIANLYDANTWYNRNLLIISNIEKQFLDPDDAREIHYFFKERPRDNSLVDHLQIQSHFGVVIALVALISHFATRVYPGLSLPINNFDPQRTVPYVIALLGIYYLVRLKTNQNAQYEKLLTRSPGIQLGSDNRQAHVTTTSGQRPKTLTSNKSSEKERP
ncbi:MAG: hypothetical protein M3362_00050 [Acidobacteriota bacterium]|nr:hypothetical protein [Acidobacteriota bacterium]